MKVKQSQNQYSWSKERQRVRWDARVYGAGPQTWPSLCAAVASARLLRAFHIFCSKLLPSFKTVSEGGFSPVRDNICEQSHVGSVWVQRLKEGGSLHTLTEGHWPLPFLSWFEIPQTSREAPELANLWWYKGRGGDAGCYWILSGFARCIC